ncbi:MAG: hypothetical protein JW706_04810, partial [Opitutales bacterium]|nr:hypothetical protein [Opitutales bacterium]
TVRSTSKRTLLFEWPLEKVAAGDSILFGRSSPLMRNGPYSFASIASLRSFVILFVVAIFPVLVLFVATPSGSS